MKSLKREDFNGLIQSAETLILYFHSPSDPLSVVGFSSAEEVDQMIGKNFHVYSVDVSVEKEIAHAMSITTIPETVCIKNKKIHKRMTGALFSNQILDLLK